MKESLSILGVKSSGLEDVKKIASKKRTDEDIFNEIDKVASPEEKEKYLREFFKKRPHGFVKSKLYLARQIKNTDLKFAFELVMYAALSAPIEPECYLLLSELAYDDKAWALANNACEIVEWLCSIDVENKETILLKAKEISVAAKEKIKAKEYDNSQNQFWINKNPDKFWILEKLYFQSKTKELVELIFNLLELFPKEVKNYENVYKALTLLDNKDLFNRFVTYVESNLQDDYLNKNLFLGMVCYYFSDFKTSVDLLKNVVKLNPLNSKALFYLALNHLMTNNLKDFIKVNKMILPESDSAFIALYFVFSAATNTELEKIEFPNHKNIAREVSLILDKLLKCDQSEAVSVVEEQFRKLNYNMILPYWQLYLGEIYIKRNLLDKAKNVLEGCTDSEIHRLYSWIYRLEGKDALAESELLEYRQSWRPDNDSGFYCFMVNLNLPDKAPEKIDEIFKHLRDAYDQTKEIIKQIELEYGLNTMTCIETGCQDCCKKTFPQVTYTEYLYMRDWLDKQPEEFKAKIFDESLKIVNHYRERFKKDPPFLVGDIVFTKHYPLDFQFDCPYLGDNKCNVYENRPFSCRGYGYSSFDGITFKGCNYFYEQFKAATKLNHIRKVLSAASFFNFTRLTDDKLIGYKIMAPIPIWFAQSHEEAVKKAKEAIFNAGIPALCP